MARVRTISPNASSAKPTKYEEIALMQPVDKPPMLVELVLVVQTEERLCSLVINHVPTAMVATLRTTAIFLITS